MVWMTPVTQMTAPPQFQAQFVETNSSGIAAGNVDATSIDKALPFSEKFLEQDNTGGIMFQPIEVTWPYPEMQGWQADCNSGNGQFAMISNSNHFVPFWQQFSIPESLGENAVEAPSQFQMDMSTSFPSSGMDATVTDSTLRRRHCGDYDPHGEEAETEDARDGYNSYDAAWERELIMELFGQLSQGEEGKEAAMTSFRRMSFGGQVSSRAAQGAITEAPSNDAALLAQGLQGHIWKAVQSKHANYVVQKILEMIPVKRTNFIVEELIGHGVAASQHTIGCRVVCRILEHAFWEDVAISRLVEEILAHAEDLCSHGFGGFVIRHILEHGLPIHRKRVAEALLKNATQHAIDPQGSHVVEAALKFCENDDQLAIVKKLLERKDVLLSIATHKYGRHVAKTLLSTSADLLKMARVALGEWAPELQKSRYGKSAFQELKKLESTYGPVTAEKIGHS
jgi:hypothetical protein